MFEKIITMKKIITIISFFFASQCIQSQVPASFFSKADQFFKTYISEGKVKYAAIKKDTSSLDILIEEIASATPTKSNKANFQAFHINAYNLLVIKGIVNNYPTKSPLDINGFFDGKKYTVAGQKTTLNGIENNILRKNYSKEPRFHFVLVCAGLGCPPIINEAYTPAKLESQLQRQTKIAINNPSFIKYDGKKLKISQIFEWYAKDFKQFGSYVDFVNKYRKEKVPTKTKVGFYSYDWALNKI